MYSDEESDIDIYYDNFEDFEEVDLQEKDLSPREQYEKNLRNFQTAVLYHNTDAVEQILNEGTFTANTALSDDWTPLLLATSAADFEMTQLLLQKGADVNIDRDKITPLMCACKCPAITVPFDKSVKVVRLLVDAGADVNAINRSRMTPFIYAGSIGNLEAVIELIPLCNIHAVDNQGWHALFWAVQEEHYAVVKKLIETGLDTDRVDVRNQSVFSMAARHFEIKMLFPQYVEDPLNFDDWQMNSNVGDFNAELRHVSPNTDKVIFFSDVAKLIYGMNLKNLTQKLFDNGLDLYTILSLDKVKMLELGIVLPLQQYRLQHGLYRFHKHPYKPKSVNIIDCDKTWHTEDITTSIFNQIRHLAVMEASLQYLMNNSVKLAKTKDIRAIERRLKNLESLLDNIHKNVVQWDKTIMSVDRITAKSIRNIKSHSHFKTICVFGSILALSVYVYRKTWH